MKDPNILDVSTRCLQEIRLLLDNKGTRDEFLCAVPTEFFDSKARQALEVQCNPGNWLLFHLGAQDARVSDFVTWFESAKLDNALMHLQVDVPLKIIVQPPCRISLQRGENLSISCKASSFPRPEFQWFKEETELLTQQYHELFIPSAKVQDSGIYICRVSKRSAQNNTYTWLFTNSIEVLVTLGPEDNSSCKNDSLALSLEQIPEILQEQDLNEENYSPPGKIMITHHPQSYAKVPQGFSFYLECVAISLGPIKYQWYKNRRILEGEVSPNLRLDYMYPDPQTGETRFEYFCEVYNNYDKEFTSVAVIQLEEPNHMTRYFAEDKIALMIANDSYEDYETLRTPATDVSDLAKILKFMHFKVFAFRNLTLIEMDKVLTVFCSMIKENSYALFFFAGHGFEHHGQTYMQPIDCSELGLPDESICAEYILQNVQERKPALNVILIDACRKCTTKWNEPSILYNAHMKNNTVYGYSTI